MPDSESSKQSTLDLIVLKTLRHLGPLPAGRTLLQAKNEGPVAGVLGRVLCPQMGS